MVTSRSCFLSAVYLAVVLATGAQTVPLPRTSLPPVQSAPQNPRSEFTYRLHLSDTLDVQLPFSPEYNQTTTVQPDGRISLREIGPLQVVGRTILEVDALIAESYGNILKQPQVSVSLKDFLKPSFYAAGEVGRPGRYEIHSDLTLLQALSEAGGLIGERAKKKDIVVFRPTGNDTYESKVLNLKRMLTAKSSVEDYPILPGDIIYVPQNRISKIQRYIPTPSLGAYISPALI